MTNEERLQRLQDEVDELRKRIDILSGRCVCPQPKRTEQWIYDEAPWWDDNYRQPCHYPKVWM